VIIVNKRNNYFIWQNNIKFIIKFKDNITIILLTFWHSLNDTIQSDKCILLIYITYRIIIISLTLIYNCNKEECKFDRGSAACNLVIRKYQQIPKTLFVPVSELTRFRWPTAIRGEIQILLTNGQIPVHGLLKIPLWHDRKLEGNTGTVRGRVSFAWHLM